MVAIGETFEQYRVDAVIDSSGKLTDVFRATDTQCDLEVSLEILRPTASSVEKARFGTRARRLAGVRHAALRTILETKPTYCVFEAPAGTVLREHTGVAIARYRQKLFWLAQVAAALALLHKAGIAHGSLGLEVIMILVDGSPKLQVPIGSDLGGSPLDDLRAFAVLACDLMLGEDHLGDEAALKAQIVEAGVPEEAAALLARVRSGASMTAADLAERLVAFTDYAGPTTEPLLPIAPGPITQRTQ